MMVMCNMKFLFSKHRIFACQCFCGTYSFIMHCNCSCDCAIFFIMILDLITGGIINSNKWLIHSIINTNDRQTCTSMVFPVGFIVSWKHWQLSCYNCTPHNVLTTHHPFNCSKGAFLVTFRTQGILEVSANYSHWMSLKGDDEFGNSDFSLNRLKLEQALERCTSLLG